MRRSNTLVTVHMYINRAIVENCYVSESWQPQLTCCGDCGNDDGVLQYRHVAPSRILRDSISCLHFAVILFTATSAVLATSEWRKPFPLLLLVPLSNYNGGATSDGIRDYEPHLLGSKTKENIKK